MRIIKLVLCSIFVSSNAFAQNYICGDTRVTIEKVGKFESSRVHISAQVNERETSLWLHSIDHVNGVCVTDKRNRNKILIKAHCGGSGCSEKTYTLIDARTLMVELVPVQGTNNLSTVESILGKKLTE